MSENDLYMPGEDIESRVSVDKGVGTTVSLWLRPLVIDTIKLSASASCTSGAADAFERDLLVKVCVLMTIKILKINIKCQFCFSHHQVAITSVTVFHIL